MLLLSLLVLLKIDSVKDEELVVSLLDVLDEEVFQTAQVGVVGLLDYLEPQV